MTHAVDVKVPISIPFSPDEQQQQFHHIYILFPKDKCCIPIVYLTKSSKSWQSVFVCIRKLSTAVWVSSLLTSFLSSNDLVIIAATCKKHVYQLGVHSNKNHLVHSFACRCMQMYTNLNNPSNMEDEESDEEDSD